MKNPPYFTGFEAAATAVCWLVLTFGLRADTNSAPVVPVTAAGIAATASSASVRLPYGVADVLNLSRARISDEVIVNYIRNSGTAYTLGPREIVYLRDEGVSDHLITVMLDQRKKVAEDNAQQAVQQATQQAAQQAIQSPAVAATPVVSATPMLVDPNGLLAPAYPGLMEPYVEEEPPAPSTLYVIPDPAVRAAYYGSRGYGLSYSPYSLTYPYYYAVGGSSVYHFGRGYGGFSGAAGRRGGVHTGPRR